MGPRGITPLGIGPNGIGNEGLRERSTMRQDERETGSLRAEGSILPGTD
jgi:hypothetical protein